MGRHKNITTPEIMWTLFCAYKTHIKSIPFLIKDWVGKDGFEVEREKERPLTMEGFELYCFEQGVINEMSHYFSNYENRYADFVAICSRIRQSIREDQISGGMAGIYNPSITQRLNNLTEKIQEDGKKELTIKVKYEKQNTNNEK